MYLLSKNDLDSLQIWIKELKEFQLDSIFDTNVLARAFLYTNSMTIETSSKNCVIGKVGDGKYEVKINSEEGSIYGDCTCPYDGKCKHLAATLLVLIDNTKSV